MNQKNTQKLEVVCPDGYPLKCTIYKPSESVSQDKLVIAGATGVPQRYYRGFAEFFVSKGLEVWTFDYRGIGESKYHSLKIFDASFVDWAQKDLNAVIGEASTNNSGNLFMIGHSFGGHAFGLLDNGSKIRKFATLATGAGWSGWMSRTEALKTRFLWNIIAPMLVKYDGYLSLSRLGMGEDLPHGVYVQWRKWCGYPNYFFGDPSMSNKTANFSNINIPILAVNSTDDLWAPPISSRAFMKHYTNAQLEYLSILPSDYGLKAIGHMGYFKARATGLWSQVSKWLLR